MPAMDSPQMDTHWYQLIDQRSVAAAISSIGIINEGWEIESLWEGDVTSNFMEFRVARETLQLKDEDFWQLY